MLISETGRFSSGSSAEGIQFIRKTMPKYMQLELKKINRRIEKAKRRLKNPKYTESESEIIDRLTLRKLELIGEK